MMKSLHFLLCTCVFYSSLSQAFWGENIWENARRPYLYYGVEKPESEKLTPRTQSPRTSSLERITDLTTLQKEFNRRKNRAMMDPSETNVAAFLEVNHFLFEKSHRFAQAFDLVRLKNPQWDWTSTHPVMNAAHVAIERKKNAAQEKLMNELIHTFGLMIAVDINQPYTKIFIKNWESILRGSPFDVLWLEKRGRRIVVHGKSIATRKAKHPVYPFVTLVPKPGFTHYQPISIPGLHSPSRWMQYAGRFYLAQKIKDATLTNQTPPITLYQDQLLQIRTTRSQP